MIHPSSSVLRFRSARNLLEQSNPRDAFPQLPSTPLPEQLVECHAAQPARVQIVEHQRQHLRRDRRAITPLRSVVQHQDRARREPTPQPQEHISSYREQVNVIKNKRLFGWGEKP